MSEVEDNARRNDVNNADIDDSDEEEELNNEPGNQNPSDEEDNGNNGNQGGNNNGGNGNPGNNNNGGVNANRPGALTPGQAMRGTLDYETNKAHFYIYRHATSKLEETPYDCTPDQFFQMMKSLEDRGHEYGWDKPGGLFWVRKRDGTMVNLLDSYGSITMKEIRRHELTYWNNGFRKSQDDRMLYECLLNSMSPEGKSRVNIHSEEYQLLDGTRRIPSGLCLLKVVVRESYLDSNATTGMIREQLSNLDSYMPTINNDITRFNNHVKMLLKALHARGEQTLDLLTYLFKAYAVCNDKEFVKYIGDLQTRHDMGTYPLTSAALMHYAEKKYKIMVTLKKWEAPSHVDDQLMALQAQVGKLHDQLKGKLQDRAGKKKNKQDGGGKKERNKTKPKSDTKDDRPDWFDKPPASGNMHETKEWKGRKWHYCCKDTGGNCGGVWRVHEPKKCKSTPKRKFQGKPKGDYGKKIPKIDLKSATFDVDSDDDSILGGYFSDE